MLLADHTSSSAPRVFLCDDVAAFRTLMRFTLEEAGCTIVGEAADGSAGIDGVAETQPDVVLLDLAMPGTDGLTALPRMREVSPGTRVVILSGFTAEGMSEELLSRGATAYLEKGTDLDEVIGVVHTVAAGSTVRVA